MQSLSTWAALLAALLLVSMTHADDKPAPDKLWVYIGTYTGPKSKGIYRLELDMASGALSEPKLAAEVSNPSFLAIHPNGKFLYAVGELPGKQAGAVSAYAIDSKTGDLHLLNQQSSGGQGPCHVVVDRAGKNVLVANYGGGSVACLPIQDDGQLKPASTFIQHHGSSVNPQRQKEPHAHSINVDAGNRFAVAADLGLDRVLVYRLDADKGELKPAEPAFTSVKPGAGPRHFAFHPNGKYAYVINEIQLTVTAFAYDPDKGTLTELQTISTLPEGATGSNFSTAEVQVHPSGKFLYGSNRGHDTIAMFAIDESTGKLTALGNESTQGKMPRNFGIDPTGKYLIAANMNSHSLVVFRIDPATGKLMDTGHKAQVGSPVCVKFLVPGK